MKIDCIIISDGTKGMENQSIAISKILGCNFKIFNIKLNFWLKYFPSLSFYFSKYFKKELNFLQNVKFKYLITTGRRMAGYSILSKIIYNRKILTIHLQNPRINPKRFDILIIPQHDKISAKNIIKTQGALSFFDLDDIKKSFKKIKTRTLTFHKPVTLLLIGGDNKRYKLSYSEYCRLLFKVKNAVQNISGSLLISLSRRTPEKVNSIAKLIFSSFKNNFCLMDDSKNFYPGILDITDYVIVTSDSINMISEIASTKTNLFVYYFREEKNKIKEFNKLIENKKYAKKFTGRLYKYNKKCLNQNHFIKNQVMKMIEEKNLFK